MKKLMKKKMSLFGKEFSVFALVAVMMVGLASAALVPYLSNTVTGTVDVQSPIEIEITGVSNGGTFTNNPGIYIVSVYGGDSFTVNTTTHIYVDGVTGHISENKITGFNGEGVTLTYTDSNWEGVVFDLPLCVVHNEDGTNDSYFYIGNSSEVLGIQDITSHTTFNAALNLDPTQNLTIESRVIMVDEAACTPTEEVGQTTLGG